MQAATPTQNIIAQLGDGFSFDAFADALANYGKAQELPTEQNDLIQALLNMGATMRKTDRIGNGLEIDVDMNTYSARHSFATVLLKSNASLAFISKSLGRTNLKTTESYLGSFDDEEAKAFLNAL